MDSNSIKSFGRFVKFLYAISTIMIGDVILFFGLPFCNKQFFLIITAIAYIYIIRCGVSHIIEPLNKGVE